MTAPHGGDFWELGVFVTPFTAMSHPSVSCVRTGNCFPAPDCWAVEPGARAVVPLGARRSTRYRETRMRKINADEWAVTGSSRGRAGLTSTLRRCASRAWAVSTVSRTPDASPSMPAHAVDVHRYLPGGYAGLDRRADDPRRYSQQRAQRPQSCFRHPRHGMAVAPLR